MMNNEYFDVNDITDFVVDITDEEILELSASSNKHIVALCIEAAYGDPVARLEVARLAIQNEVQQTNV